MNQKNNISRKAFQNIQSDSRVKNPKWVAWIAFGLGMVIAANVGCAEKAGHMTSVNSGSLAELSNIRLSSGRMGGVRKFRADENLAETIRQHDGKVVLDFYADWCGPCKRQGRILETMDPLFEKNDVAVIKINVDQQPKLKESFGVSGLPTLVLVQDGQVVDQSVGLADGPRLKEWVGLDVESLN